MHFLHIVIQRTSVLWFTYLTPICHILRKGAIKIYSTCTDNTKDLNAAHLMHYIKSKLRCHCCTTNVYATNNTVKGTHLFRLCLQKCCMLALLLDSLSGCPLSSHHQCGGCLWLQSTFYGLGAVHWWRMSPVLFLLPHQFLQARGEDKNRSDISAKPIEKKNSLKLEIPSTLFIQPVSFCFSLKHHCS